MCNSSYMYNHARICFWKQTVLYTKGKVSCSKKQWVLLIGIELAPDMYTRSKHGFNWNNIHDYLSDARVCYIRYTCSYMRVYVFVSWWICWGVRACLWVNFVIKPVHNYTLSMAIVLRLRFIGYSFIFAAQTFLPDNIIEV